MLSPETLYKINISEINALRQSQATILVFSGGITSYIISALIAANIAALASEKKDVIKAIKEINFFTLKRIVPLFLSLVIVLFTEKAFQISSLQSDKTGFCNLLDELGFGTYVVCTSLGAFIFLSFSIASNYDKNILNK